MRILHCSDNHGTFPQMHGNFDIIVNSGDFFPNSPNVFSKNKNLEMAFQLQWLRNNLDNIKQWLGDHTFLYTAGNHCFLHPDAMEFELQKAGIKAYSLNNKLFSYQGVNFYGFPFVPDFGGTWNYELKLPEMQDKVNEMTEVLNKSFVDVLVCHCPPYDCLDLTYGGVKIGNTCINNMLDYKLFSHMVPTAYLTGHCHESAGITIRNGLLVSNAATTYQIIQL
jgi:Icc-related predicted phosphoesterase